MNFVEIAGHLGADPEERFTPTGKRVISLRVATKTRHNGKDDTIWWRVSIWGDRFDKMIPYFRKGSPIIVIGEMSKPEVYQDKEGKQQVSLTITAEMVRFSPFGKPADKPQSVTGSSHAPSPSHEREEVGVASIDDSGFTGDDLPF